MSGGRHNNVKLPEIIIIFFIFSNINFRHIKETPQETFLLHTKTICYNRKLLKYFMNIFGIYSLNPVCPTFFTYYLVFRKFGVRIFEVLLY